MDFRWVLMVQTNLSPVDMLRSAVQVSDTNLNAAYNRCLANDAGDNNLERDELARNVRPVLERLVAGGYVPFSISTAAYRMQRFVDIATSPRCDWTNAAYFGMINEMYEKLRPEIVGIAKERERVEKGIPPGESGLQTAMR